MAECCQGAILTFHASVISKNTSIEVSAGLAACLQLVGPSSA